MQYSFDKIIDRRTTDSLKWNVGAEELPMWVADMDFETAPEIKEMIVARAEHGVFGYADLTDAWYDAYIGWWQKRHHYTIQKDWLVYSTGVVPTISAVVRKLTTPAEKVVILTPVYNIFYNSILNNGRNVSECPLLYDGRKYDIDFEELEKQLCDPQAAMLLFCNPHNPVGKIWDRETLNKVGRLCLQYGVTIVSDEIHCDILEPDCSYIPFGAVSEEISEIVVTCIAPTKAFNLAGIQTSAVVVKNPFLRHKVWRELNTDEVGEPNAFAVTAAVAAFTKGEPWLEALRRYIAENKRVVTEYLEKETPAISVVKGEATYLMWLDCSRLFNNRKYSGQQESNNKLKSSVIMLVTEKRAGREYRSVDGVREEDGLESNELLQIGDRQNQRAMRQVADAKELAAFIREKTGLFLSDGVQYGRGGEYFLRLNVACPRSQLLDGLERLKRGVALYQKS